MLGFWLAIVAASSGQTQPHRVDRLVETQIRAKLNLPSEVSLAFGERKPSSTEGFDMLPVTFARKEHSVTLELLISRDNKTLARLQIFNIADDVMKRIDFKGRPIRGSEKAMVTIVSYDDFQCPYCAMMHDVLMNQVLKKFDGKVKVVYKDYPLLKIHPWAMHAAINANCLGRQSQDAYWAYTDHIHTNQEAITGSRRPVIQQLIELDKASLDYGNRFQLDAAALMSCVNAQEEKEVRTSLAEGTALGVESTPTLFVNGEKVSGALPFAVIETVVKRALNDVEIPH